MLRRPRPQDPAWACCPEGTVHTETQGTGHGVGHMSPGTGQVEELFPLWRHLEWPRGTRGQPLAIVGYPGRSPIPTPSAFCLPPWLSLFLSKYLLLLSELLPWLQASQELRVHVGL